MAQLSKYARQLREMGARRIARLENAIKSVNATERTINWAKNQIKEIKSAAQGTRMYNPKTGKKYKSKSESYISHQMSRLSRAISQVEPRYTVEGDPFEVTQRELNKASVGKPSVYTKKEAKLFYRVTQNIWWDGVAEGARNRNETIVDYFNSVRRDNGLSPLQFNEIVEYVLKSNDTLLKMQDLDTQEMTEEQRELYGEASKNDNADGDYRSPTDIGAAAIQDIRDALSNLMVEANPLKA